MIEAVQRGHYPMVHEPYLLGLVSVCSCDDDQAGDRYAVWYPAYSSVLWHAITAVIPRHVPPRLSSDCYRWAPGCCIAEQNS